ncbi:hypothetical protein C8A03DRAFT_48381 [Achaetomium macrosporum]|uniref:Uncharacterized protein n=1 Tax=Achaetomium macrosporum TaxID=79813 RepID=A0AAN7C1M6_9PEZI|nr:hypothetical protein C8A03DRAFT_48381 [Achaetomium macrosporum]
MAPRAPHGASAVSRGGITLTAGILLIHKHWWNRRPEEKQGGSTTDAVGVQCSSDSVTATSGRAVMDLTGPLDIPLEPAPIKSKGRPKGAIAASKKPGASITGTRRLPSEFEYALEDELATAAPAASTKQQQQAGTTSIKRFGPGAIQGKQQQQQQMQQQGQQQDRHNDDKEPQTQTKTRDCIVVAVTLRNTGVTTNPRQAGNLYEPGTAAPRASERFIDALDTLDPDVEDAHDAALAAAEAEARDELEDALE